MKSVFVGVGCGKTSNSLSWDHINDLVIYSTGVLLAFYHPRVPMVVHVAGEAVVEPEEITCIEILVSFPQNVIIAAGTRNGSISLWEYSTVNPCKTPQTKLLAKLDSELSGVNCMASAGNLLVACSADHSIRLWNWKEHVLLHTISLGSGCIQQCIEMFVFQENLVVLSGGVDCQIHVFWGNLHEMSSFKEMHTLKGHGNWVRSIRVTETNALGEYLAASADQNGSIRIWTLCCQDNKLVVKIDSILEAHEDWIYALDWDSSGQRHRLLSSSMDETMAIWEYDDSSMLWVNESRVGIFGGQNKLGFTNAVFGPGGDSILSTSISGSLHLWSRNNPQRTYVPLPSPSGHSGPVVDVAFEPSQAKYLISVSKDQTTRLWSPITENTWHEIARPQVHGYDLSSVAFVPHTPHRFISTAEEKVIRVFDAPQSVVDFLSSKAEYTEKDSVERVLRAGVPELGLSNQAQDTSVESHQVFGEQAPLEEFLLRNTLYPEVEKLYGHVYEVFHVCSSPDGQFMVSSCVAKQSQGEQAPAHLWDLAKNRLICKLPDGHQQTVTQSKFSNSGEFVLSVSRDRHFSIVNVSSPSSPVLVSRHKAHSRIIWSCDWTENDSHFFTGSRDKKVKFWKFPECTLEQTLSFDYSVTSLCVSRFISESIFILFVGLENGHIIPFKFEQGSFTRIPTPESIHHSGTVRKLSVTNLNDGKTRLVSCGDDHSVRMNQFSFSI